MTTVLIGVDDTDFGDSPGTGKLARRLSNEIARFGGQPLGITGHQYLIDPRIPYTGHNRGICLAVDWDGHLKELDFVFDLVRDWSAEGSDPGVCIAVADAVTAGVMAWGESAMRVVLTMMAAQALAGENGLDLRQLGGTGQGIIGALASVGLRAGGTHGRFVDLPGLRELGDIVSAEKLALMGIVLEHREPATASRSRNSAQRSIYKTLGWVRPRLCGGKPVLAVEWSDEHDAFIPVDRKKVHPLE